MIKRRPNNPLQITVKPKHRIRVWSRALRGKVVVRTRDNDTQGVLEPNAKGFHFRGMHADCRGGE